VFNKIIEILTKNEKEKNQQSLERLNYKKKAVQDVLESLYRDKNGLPSAAKLDKGKISSFVVAYTQKSVGDVVFVPLHRFPWSIDFTEEMARLFWTNLNDNIEGGIKFEFGGACWSDLEDPFARLMAARVAIAKGREQIIPKKEIDKMWDDNPLCGAIPLGFKKGEPTTLMVLVANEPVAEDVQQATRRGEYADDFINGICESYGRGGCELPSTSKVNEGDVWRFLQLQRQSGLMPKTEMVKKTMFISLNISVLREADGGKEVMKSLLVNLDQTIEGGIRFSPGDPYWGKEENREQTDIFERFMSERVNLFTTCEEKWPDPKWAGIRQAQWCGPLFGAIPLGFKKGEPDTIVILVA